MRLTYKLKEPIITKYLHYDYMLIADYDIKRGNYGKISQDEIYNKLGQLEDIEDELGIDLITLFQTILLKGIYVRCDKSYEHIPPKDLWLRTDVKPYIIDFKQSDQPHYLKDYGKTWALTKGELQEP